jgi:hypothetical protein
VHVTQTAISENQEEPSVEEALAVAMRFGLKPTAAKSMLREIFMAVAKWRALGGRLHLKKATLTAYESAFENPFMTEAKILLSA